MFLPYRSGSDVAVLDGEGIGEYGVRMDEGRVNRDSILVDCPYYCPFIGDCPYYAPDFSPVAVRTIPFSHSIIFMDIFPVTRPVSLLIYTSR